jgi:hypothetical protein
VLNLLNKIIYLAELGEASVSKEWHVAHQLMAAVWLWGVKGITGMPENEILSGGHCYELL